MKNCYGRNITTGKDDETEDWVVYCVELELCDHSIKSKLELGRGNTIEEAYCNCIDDLLSAVRNTICVAETNFKSTSRYLGKYSQEKDNKSDGDN